MSVKEFCEKYYISRKGTNSLKWDALDARFGDPDLISMWVADMEFKTAQPIIDALIHRVQHGIYGYSYVPDSYYESFINWENEHHGFQPKKEWIRITPGIVAALYWFVNMFTKENDSVIILTPVYYPFHNCVKDNNRKLVTCDLNYSKGQFTVNYEKFETKIIENDVKMFILCSPHNPAGRVWTSEELERMLAICKKHNVLVVSDEIHQDIPAPGCKHIPSATIANGKYMDDIITCNAPSKTFNLATCLTSNIIISCPEKRAIYDEYIKKVAQVEVNVFGITAAEAAYRYGSEWRGEVLDVIYSNYNYVKEQMKEFPEVYIAPLEGTYLVFMDLRAYVPLENIKDFTQNKCRLAVDYGEWFGENWKGFIRLNMGTHPDIVKKAVENIKLALKTQYCK